MSEAKYQNWRQSIDVDYFSLYIKSWFAYLSTLHELYKDVDINSGDGKLIKEAVKNIAIPANTNEDIYQCICDIHKASNKLILNDEKLKKYHFYTFYRLNEEFKQKQEIQNRKNKFSYEIKIGKDKENKNDKILYIEIKDNRKETETLLKNSKKYFLTGKISIDKFISNNNYNKDDILDQLKENVENNLTEIYKPLTKKQKEKAENNLALLSNK